MAQFVVLEGLGVLEPEQVNRISQKGSRIGGHPDRGTPGIVASTGSLGHGLPLALGIARGQREHARPGRVFVVMSDGELMEGSVWEALLLGPSLGITNVTVVIDHNGSISRGDIAAVQPNLLPIAPKLAAFGWDTCEVDGHDTAAIVAAVNGATATAPRAIVAHTIKGKGVSFMENSVLWHYRNAQGQEYEAAAAELERFAAADYKGCSHA